MAHLLAEGSMPIDDDPSSTPQPSEPAPETDSHLIGDGVAQPSTQSPPDAVASPQFQQLHTGPWAPPAAAHASVGHNPASLQPSAPMNSPSSPGQITTNSNLPTYIPVVDMHTQNINDIYASLAQLIEAVAQNSTAHHHPGGPAPTATASASPQGPTPIAPSVPPSTTNSTVASFNAFIASQVANLTPVTPAFTGITNNNAATTLFNLGPANANLKQFLTSWGRLGLQRRRGQQAVNTPDLSAITAELSNFKKEVKYGDLKGDDLDLQGINWTSMGVCRREARTFREMIYQNYCANESDTWKPFPTQIMPQNTETYFRFKKFETRKPGYLVHFQLRHLLAAPSRSRILYADRKGIVRQYDAVNDKTDIALRFPPSSRTLITAIAAGEGHIVAGGLEGEYCTTKMESVYGGGEGFDNHSSYGLANLQSGISNHIQVHSRRSGGAPVAALASNDSHLRLLDLTTQKVVSDVAFAFPINCSAVSPDRKLRVVVGDDRLAYIVAAEHERSPLLPDDAFSKPDVLQTLGGHKDFGFACAWADDGYTLATGHQDRAIKIWDSRKTCSASGVWTPIATLRTSMASARSLHFSPAGSGKRLLVAAEEADMINIIDAQTFQKRQAFDLFGELAGVTFTDNGQDLFALCTDSERGGILHLQRDGIISSAVGFDESPHPARPGFSRYDWPEPGDPHSRLRNRGMRRRLRTAATMNLQPF
ncbi:hypothetical protein SEPCBS119000_000531 [Sporothrix epigloea]|uniref:DUF2415 domain-containing protein n=1 Tax=Sporothrix epigloea TaxID=1892477 RepID=A0ABP0D6N4_9PEZI